MAALSTTNIDIQNLTNLFENLSISTTLKCMLTTMNTMDLDFQELVNLLENFHISTSLKDTQDTTINISTKDIQELIDTLDNFHISTLSEGIRDSRMTANTMDFQQLIDLLDNIHISMSPKNTTATRNLKALAEAKTTSDSTLDTTTTTVEFQQLIELVENFHISTSLKSTPSTNSISSTETQNLNDFSEVEIASIASASSGTLDLSSDSLSTTSDITSEIGVSSPSPNLINFIEFNDRSSGARDARLANSILSLDEDIPEDVDDTIKMLLKNHTTAGMKFDDQYLEYKQQMATRRFPEKKLPTSKARIIRQK